MARTSRLIKKAQRRVDEPVLAAVGVQPGSASGDGRSALGGATNVTSMGLAVLGIFGGLVARRVHRWRQAKRSGLPLSIFMLLAVSADRVYLFKTGSLWRPRRTIAAWDRHDVRIDVVRGTVSTREILLDIPNERRRVALEASQGMAKRFAAAVSSSPVALSA